MADILRELHGQTQNHAPLSSSQTITVVSYLYDLHVDQTRQFNELRNRVMQNYSGVDDLRAAVAGIESVARAQEQGSRETNGQLALLKEEVLVNSERTVRLRECANACQESIEQLRAGLKVTNTNVQCLREEQKEHGDRIAKLRRDLDRGAKSQLTQLEEGLAGSVLRVQGLEEGLERCKMTQLHHKDSLRTLDVNVAAAADGISLLSAASADQAKEITTIGARLGKTVVDLETTNAVMMKIHDEVEANRAETGGLRGEHQSLDARHELLFVEHTKASKQADAAVEGVKRLDAVCTTTRLGLDENIDDVSKLQNGYRQTCKTMEELEGRLNRTDVRIKSTQENLAVTNALALPNLKSEGLVSPSMATGGGSAQSARSARSSQASKRKEATWINRNIGCVPDRMAWL